MSTSKMERNIMQICKMYIYIFTNFPIFIRVLLHFIFPPLLLIFLKCIFLYLSSSTFFSYISFLKYYFAPIFECIFVVQKARLLPKMLVSFLNSRDFMLNIFPVFSNFCVRKTRPVLAKHCSLSLSLSLLSQ